jgi:hypothetical protein
MSTYILMFSAHIPVRVVLRRKESLLQLLCIYPFVAKVACSKCSIHNRIPVLTILFEWLMKVLIIQAEWKFMKDLPNTTSKQSCLFL